MSRTTGCSGSVCQIVYVSASEVTAQVDLVALDPVRLGRTIIPTREPITLSLALPPRQRDALRMIHRLRTWAEHVRTCQVMTCPRPTGGELVRISRGRADLLAELVFTHERIHTES